MLVEMILPLRLSAIMASCRAQLALLLVVAGAAVFLALEPSARADSTDLSLLFVTKTELYLQNSPANPVVQLNPFTVKVGANHAANRPNGIVSGVVQKPPPLNTFQNLTNDGTGNFVLVGGNFADVASLNASFPNGTYNFTLQTLTAPTTYNDSVSIAGDTYPNNIPKILNGTWSSGGLQIDPTQSYSFNWNDISPTASTQMMFEIADASGAIIFSRVLPPDPTGANIVLTMPASTLQAGAYYTATLTFQRRQVATINGTFSKVATYATATTFKIATIGGPPALSGPGAALGTVGQMFVYQLIATNHPFGYGANPLPAGLSLDSTLGIISGIPTAPAGSNQVQLTATNILGTSPAKNLALTIQPAPSPGPVIISSTSALAYAGQFFSFQVVTQGATSAARITAVGLPAGLTLDPITGVISGTTNLVGSFSVNLSVKDGSFTAAGFIQLTFTADGGYPVITNANKVTVPRAQPFSYTIATPGASDPVDPPSYSVIGTLPQGLGFNAATATISGTYTGPLQNAKSTTDGGGDPPIVKELSGGALLGSVQLFGTNSHGTSTFQLLFLAPPSGAVNISTRATVGSGDNVLIGGFIVTGNAPKVVIIRALGPSTKLAAALQDPTLELHDSLGHVVFNDDWRSSQEQIIKDTTIPPSDDRESAIVISLDPGPYTAIVAGKSGATGIALVEVYDLGTASLDSGSKAQLAQISTRGNVLTGDNVMIGGFIISGVQTKVIARGIGPSLTAFGVANALQDPTLELHDSNGATLRSNDNWKIREDGTSQQAEVEATTVPPKDDRESAIVQSLVPGAYTAILRGKANTTGVALVEIYALQ
jgi:hypothetical protein